MFASTFKSICFALAGYMTILQTERYFANEDSSSFAHRQFNELPEDKYPAYTFCFVSLGGDIFDEKPLRKTLEITGKAYAQLLNGIALEHPNISASHLGRILAYKYEDVVINITKLKPQFATVYGSASASAETKAEISVLGGNCTLKK